MTAYVHPFLRPMWARAQRAAVVHGVVLVSGGVVVCLGLHILQPSTVAEGLMNAGIMAVLSAKGMKL